MFFSLGFSSETFSVTSVFKSLTGLSIRHGVRSKLPADERIVDHTFFVVPGSGDA
jgi:hypothetical protein